MHDKGKDEPTHLQDLIIESQLHEARDMFIQLIRPDSCFIELACAGGVSPDAN
jgi:hypothetical protein